MSEQTATVKVSALEKIKKMITPKTAAIAGGALVVIIAAVVLLIAQPWATWVVKINGNKITLSEFDSIYYAHNHMNYAGKSDSDIDKMAGDPIELSRNPLLSKEEFLRQLITSRLIYQKAAQEGFTSKYEVQILAEIQMQNVVSDFYFAQTLKDKTTVSDKEVEDAYIQYQSQFKGVPIDEATSRIRSQLTQQKVGAERNKIMRDMRESVRIERDETLFAKLLSADKSKRPTSGTLVTIEGAKIKSKKISVKEFTTLYYSQNKIMAGEKNEEAIDKMAADPASLQQNPSLDKKEFLEQMITQYSIYSNVLAEGILKDKKLSTLTSVMNEQFIGMYYVKEAYAKEFETSDEEVSVEYEKNKSQFPARVTKDMAFIYIRGRIESQKLSEKFPEIARKIKESALIEKNEKVIKSFERKPAAESEKK
jgi:hypothetical protein